MTITQKIFITCLALSSLLLAKGQLPSTKYCNNYGNQLIGIPYQPKGYVCYRTEKVINIDGEIKEESWNKTAWSDNFSDIEGGLKPKPTYNTRTKMLWDDQYLYIAAELEEPNLWATITKRDEIIFQDNDFEIFIDPDGDTHGYYEFEINALNTVWDLLLIRPYRESVAIVDSWDIQGLKSAVKLYGTLNNPSDTDTKWTLEVALPWDVLKEFNRNNKPRHGDQWRINFSRIEWKLNTTNGIYSKTINPKTGKPFPESNWVWSPQGLIDMHFPELWGFIQFSKHNTGSITEKFEWNIEEDVKWELRNIYYAQRKYSGKNKKYANSFNQLESVGLNTNNFKFSPKIYTTLSLYEVTATRKHSKLIWHIDNTGRTWSSQKK